MDVPIISPDRRVKRLEGCFILLVITKYRTAVKRNGINDARDSTRLTASRPDMKANRASRMIGRSKGVSLSFIFPSIRVLVLRISTERPTAKARRICLGKMKASVEMLRKKSGVRRKRRKRV
jgi:hypothetical protein